MPTGEERFLIASPRRVFGAQALIASSQATPGMAVTNLARYEPDEPWRATNLSGLKLDVELASPADWNVVALLYSSFAKGNWGDFYRVSSSTSQAGLDSPVWTSGWQHALVVAYDAEIYPFIHSLLWLGAAGARTEPWVRIEFLVGERFLTFNGSTSGASGGDIFDVGAGASMTVRVRFRTGTTGVSQILASKRDFITAAGSPPGWNLNLNNVNDFLFAIADGTTRVRSGVAAQNYADGAWHEGWGVIDRTAGTIRVRVDGVSYAGSSISGVGDASNATGLYLGRSGNGTNRYTGDLDEIAVWTRALSDAEMAAREGKPLERSDADSYWQAEEGTGTAVADMEGTNDLTLTDVTWGSSGASLFDLGALVVDKAYQPPYHVRPGFTHAWRDFGARRTTDAGKLRTATGLRPRTHTYAWELPFADAMARSSELARRYGSTEPVLAVYDPDDTVNRQELMIYGALRVEDGDLVDEAPDLLAKRIVIDEIL